jgi:hypothetical protein
MIDMQLLNNALVALAVLVGAAITLSIAIVAVAAITNRVRSGGTGGTRRDLPRHPAPATGSGDDRRLVLR